MRENVRMDTAHHVLAPRIAGRARSLAVGCGLLLAGLAMFAGLLDGVREHADLSAYDSPVLTWLLARRSGGATAVFTRISWLADPPVLTAAILTIVVALVWRTRRVRPGLLLGGAMGLTLATSSAVKVLVARPRPPVAEMVAPAELSFAFPSGHTLGAAVALLVLSYLWWTARPTVRVAAAGAAISTVGTLCVATRRLYLGYHWFTDVSASMTLAVAILGVVILVDRLLLERAGRHWVTREATERREPGASMLSANTRALARSARNGPTARARTAGSPNRGTRSTD